VSQSIFSNPLPLLWSAPHILFLSILHGNVFLSSLASQIHPPFFLVSSTYLGRCDQETVAGVRTSSFGMSVHPASRSICKVSTLGPWSTAQCWWPACLNLDVSKHTMLAPPQGPVRALHFQRSCPSQSAKPLWAKRTPNLSLGTSNVQANGVHGVGSLFREHFPRYLAEKRLCRGLEIQITVSFYMIYGYFQIEIIVTSPAAPFHCQIRNLSSPAL
jgi:hypothetical protein